ncbi:MAG TPA: MMPL family transporter [Thermoanaerobaculia bacterium]
MLGRLSSARAAYAAYVAYIARRPRLVLAAAVLLTLAALIPASRFHVETQLEALLPEGAPAATDYRAFLRTFGGFEKVFVLVRAAGGKRVETEALVNAAAELADRMRRSPLVADARAGLTEEDERFFFAHVAPRMPLLVHAPGWREDLARRLEPAAIHERVAEMRQALRSPVGAVAAPLYAADPLGLSEGLLGAAAASLPIDPLSGAFVSPDGTATLVILTPARAEVDSAGGRALLAALRTAYGEVRGSAGVPLDFQAVGGPIYAAQDEAAFRADLESTASGTFVGLALVMILGFEGLFLPAAILAAVAAGTVWMMGGASLGLGSISVLGVGFTAALLGMGVDYGILGSSLFRDLRLRGMGVAPALAAAFRETGPGIATTAVTTAAGLAALTIAHFRLLRELGQVLSLGVIATLVATATLAAALLAAFPRASARFRPLRLWPRFGQPVLTRIADLAAGRWRAALALVALMTVLAGWGISRLELSTDLRALRPADAPSGEAEKLLVQKFAVGLDTFSVVLRGRTLGEALDRAAAARAILEQRLGPKAEITSPADWLVLGHRLDRRLAELRGLPLERAADDFQRELAAAGFKLDRFAPALATLRELGRGENAGALPLPEWPRWMSELVRLEKPPGGREPGAVVAVHVRLPLGMGARMDAAALARELARLAPDRRDVALASFAWVGAELRDLALSDLLRSSALALVLVGAVVLASFRWRLRDALLAALPLTLGCLWTFGLWGLLGLPLDLLCAFTVPLLLGTGTTLGANAVHWKRLHPDRGFKAAAADLGLPLTLATLTTVIGFGSLSTSRVPGLRHAGVLVAVGLSACLLATVLVLPALEAALERRRPGPSPGSSPESWDNGKEKADRPDPGRT